jgi:hypothetical protein
MTMLLLRLALVNRRRTAPGPRLLAEENRERLKTVVEAQIGSLPDDHLLDAAHIMADSHELLGQPVVVDGIALSKMDPPRGV